jgi:DNA-directed RNA polymerase I, II, and III subunit RPABC2
MESSARLICEEVLKQLRGPEGITIDEECIARNQVLSVFYGKLNGLTVTRTNSLRALTLEERQQWWQTKLLELAQPVPRKVENTSRYMNKFERASVLGHRAMQLSLGADSVVPYQGDPMETAKQELRDGNLPVCLRRYLVDDTSECVPLSALTYTE